MARWDIEGVLDALETYLKANLNTKITAINTEKGDSLLSQVSTSAYNKQVLNEYSVNHDPFLILGVIDNISVVGEGPVSIQTFNIDVIIFFSEQSASNTYKLIWRYQRALRETIQDGYNDIFRQVKFKLSGLTPTTIAIKNDSQEHVGIGVSLTVSIT